MAEKPFVLVIDDVLGKADNPSVRDTYRSAPVRWLLESAADPNGGYSAARALERVSKEANRLAAVLLDIGFGKDLRLGVEILRRIRDEYPTLPVLMFTAFKRDEERELAFECMELGANEYVQKPADELRLNEVLSVYTDPAGDRAVYGNSLAARRLRAQIARVAISPLQAVLLIGETGTGKELVARALHRQGRKPQGEFVAENAGGSMGADLSESKLFGHVKGAFTDAKADRTGLLELASGGTLFLDEVAAMPLDLQVKLLRALEERTFRRMGSNKEIKVSFRLVCACQENPISLVQAGRLREDLFFRISQATVELPPLRDRGEDIPLLANLFLRRFKSREGGASLPAASFSNAALEKLLEHNWPGNVRELKNIVERAAAMAASEKIGASDIKITRLRGDPPDGGRTGPIEDGLPEDRHLWPRARLMAELQMAVEARQRVRKTKGKTWRAEFMRAMYPQHSRLNPEGVKGLVNRLTQKPWGDPEWEKDPEFARLIRELLEE